MRKQSALLLVSPPFLVTGMQPTDTDDIFDRATADVCHEFGSVILQVRHWPAQSHSSIRCWRRRRASPHEAKYANEE